MDTQEPNPSGLCMCGCGEPAPIARITSRARGRIKGKPMRYVRGHNMRRTPEAYYIDPETGCWEWLRNRGPDGYGKVRHNGRIAPAHRAMYEQHYGLVAPDMDVHHVCENRGCVNPEHLRLVHETRHGRIHSPLSEDDVAAIRSALRVHGSGRALARRYGVTEAVISDIRTGRSWQ